MRRRHNQSKNTMFLVIILLLIGIGIAYAILTETLTINNTVSYDAMKWDVGFTSAEDGYDPFIDLYIEMFEKNEGVTLDENEKAYLAEMITEEFLGDEKLLATSTATISEDKKSITINCDLELSSKAQVCIVKATISNSSTFNIAISETPVVTYDDTYVNSVDVMWLNHDIYGFLTNVLGGQTLETNENANVFLAIYTKELTEEMLPSTELSIPITISLDFEETDVSFSELAMLKTQEYNNKFWSETYRDKIKNITFESQTNIPENVVESWDIGIVQNGNVMAYVVRNESDSAYYDLYIQSDEQLYANWDMGGWFQNFKNLDSINGLELLDTRYTTDMNYMFYNTGYNSEIFTLDVSNFDTRNVTDMYAMFMGAGYNSTLFTLDVSNFDTSNVTDMSYMFYGTGHNNKTFMLDVSNFNTSNVTNMGGMFSGCNYLETVDLSNFNTANVTHMHNMFQNCWKLTSLNLSSFDTSNVTTMLNMFGSCNKLMHLDIRNFNFNSDKLVTSSGMFTKVPTDCEIIIKGDTEKQWMNENFPELTNVKTVAEYEASL
mgnify:CR=1 FL=1